jgi:hypothetical protein
MFITQRRLCRVIVSVLPVTGNCDDEATLFGDSQLTRARVDCTGGSGRSGRIAVAGYCDCSTLDDRVHLRLEYGVQRIHPRMLEGCDPLV